MPRRLKIALTIVLALVFTAFVGVFWLTEHHTDAGHCAACHATSSYHTSQAARSYLFHRHAECAVYCESCHSYALRDALSQVINEFHDSYEIPLAVDPAQNCMRCHGGEVQVGEGQAGAGHPAVEPHLSGITCSLCHDMPNPSETLCSECHQAGLAAK